MKLKKLFSILVFSYLSHISSGAVWAFSDSCAVPIKETQLLNQLECNETNMLYMEDHTTQVVPGINQVDVLKFGNEVNNTETTVQIYREDRESEIKERFTDKMIFRGTIDLDRFHLGGSYLMEEGNDDFVYLVDEIELPKLFSASNFRPESSTLESKLMVRRPNFSNLSSFKSILFLVSILGLASSVEAGPVACAACIKAQPELFIAMFEGCFPLMPILPLWLICMGGSVTADGLACFALCGGPLP